MKVLTAKILLFALITPFFALSQVGIGTTTPNAQLDIRSTNQATPANTDGILIPKVDEFPITAPTASQDGMMVFVTGSGAPVKGFYYWNNATTSWILFTSIADKDWYEESTTSPPDAITDDIFTMGNVAIGKNTADYSLDIQITGLRGISMIQEDTNNGTIFGNHIDISNTGSGIHYGVFNTLKGAGTGDQHGIKNHITNTEDGIHYGVTNILSGTGSGEHYGVFNSLTGSGEGSQYGIKSGISNSNDAAHKGSSNTLSGTGSGNHYGTFNTLSGVGTGQQTGTRNVINNSNNSIHFGVYNLLNGTGNSTRYGVYNALQGSGSGNKYGSYNSIIAGSGGFHYGVYSNVLKAGSFAGYFLGNVSIGTTGGNSYILPPSRGTANQIMQTDGSGSVTWSDTVDTQNTLDEAYDEGGAGAGRTITATDGAVTIAGEDGLLVSGTLGSGDVAPSGAGTKMYFNPRKAAFRAGYATSSQWDDTNVGNYSTAFGYANIASGAGSTALGGGATTASGSSSIATGESTTASGNSSTAMGYSTTASGQNSFSIGFGTIASGNSSAAMGLSTVAPSFSETTLGLFNTTYTPNSTSAWNASDRLFVIGNGADAASKSNALTIYKNGLLNINDEYNMPLTDGTPNQVMQTDGSGSLSWVDTSALDDGDWVTVGADIERQSGDVYIGDTAGTNNDLYVSGFIYDWDTPSFYLNPGNLNVMNEIQFDNGAVNNPKIRFEDANTGFYRPAANEIALTISNTQRFRVRSNGKVSFGNEGTHFDFPLARGTANQVMQTDGSGILSWVDTSALDDGDWVTVGADIERQSGDVYIGDTAGTNNDLYLSGFLYDWDTPSYYVNPGNLNIMNEIQFDNGAVNNPKIRFADANTGFYRPAANEIALTISNTQRFRVRSTGKVSFGNEGTHFDFPLARGTANQVMQTDGTGNLSWVDATSVGTDDQNISGSGLSGTDLTINIENGNSEIIDLSSLQDGVGAQKINDLSDGKSDNDGTNNGSSIFLGVNAGFNDDSSNNRNVGFGSSALQQNTDGEWNIAMGYQSLFSNINGSYNVAIGNWAGKNTTGDRNTIMGTTAFNDNTTGVENVVIGSVAGRHLIGSNNVLLGRQAGHGAGAGSYTMDGSVFIGNNSGYYETNSNRLYVENSSISSPLIYGEFDNDLLRVNGDFEVAYTTANVKVLADDGNLASLKLFEGANFGFEFLYDGSTDELNLWSRNFSGNEAERMTWLKNGNVGIGNNNPNYKLEITGAVMLEDMAAPSATAGHSGIYSNAGELNALDASGNSTVISPHHFSLTQPSEEMAWSFYSKNETLGKQVNVDMMKAMRLIEALSGEKLIYQADLFGNNIASEITENSFIQKVETLSEENVLLKEQLESQQTQIEELKKLVQQLLDKK